MPRGEEVGGHHFPENWEKQGPPATFDGGPAIPTPGEALAGLGDLWTVTSPRNAPGLGDVALLGTSPFIFPKLLPDLLLLPAGHTSFTASWVLSPSLARLASWEDIVIKAIRNLLMKPSTPAGEHFPITWTIFAILDFSVALLKAQADAAGVALPPLPGAVTSRLLQGLMGQVLP